MSTNHQILRIQILSLGRSMSEAAPEDKVMAWGFGVPVIVIILSNALSAAII